MNDSPKNLMEFEERFATEEACLAFAKAKKPTQPDGLGRSRGDNILNVL